MDAHETSSWPKKTREVVDGWMLDSTVWNDLEYRDGDVVIASYGKAGSTWVQQIVAQLIFSGEDVDVGAISPWLEFMASPRQATLGLLDSQSHRRFYKTHLPVDAMPLSRKAKYIYVARDGRDVVWSYHKFFSSFGEPPPGIVELIAAGRAKPPPPINPDVREFYHEWLDRDGYPFLPFFSHVQGWWDVRGLPNILMVHFSALKADMPGQIRRIADFLDISVPSDAWRRILEHCSFNYMKQHADAVAPPGAATLEGGRKAFFHAGTNGRWRDVLSPAESEKYERAARSRLSPDCAHWLAT
jgi:aryl sulfotransferase